MPSQRDPWFDNAKMLLVTLVVVGHSWTLLSQNTWDQWTYDFLYFWHVPAFVLVTGYLSQSFSWQPRRLWSLVKTVVVPYLIFEGLLAWFRIKVGGIEMDDIWQDPHWPMWYLSALFFWRLMTPIFKRLPAKVVVAVLLSLAAGLWAGDTFDAARIFGLLPFFVLGLKMHGGHWEMLRARRARWAGVVVLLAIFVLARFTDSWIETEWLYYRSRYDTLVPDDTRALTIRMVLLLVGLVGALAFFAIVPRRQTWFTDLGSATLVVYLFHGFVILGLRYAGYQEWTAAHPYLGFVVTTAWAVALAFVLAWRPLSRRLNYAVDPIGTIERRAKQVIAPG